MFIDWVFFALSGIATSCGKWTILWISEMRSSHAHWTIIITIISSKQETFNWHHWVENLSPFSKASIAKFLWLPLQKECLTRNEAMFQNHSRSRSLDQNKLIHGLYRTKLIRKLFIRGTTQTISNKKVIAENNLVVTDHEKIFANGATRSLELETILFKFKLHECSCALKKSQNSSIQAETFFKIYKSQRTSNPFTGRDRV